MHTIISFIVNIEFQLMWIKLSIWNPDNASFQTFIILIYF